MKVGNYVRTKRGLIAKIVNINTFREPCMKYGIDLDDIWFIGDDDIKLVKDKPIDLIEVGDLVTLTSKYCENEVYRVIHTFKDNNDTIIELDCFQDGTMFISKSEDIKSIVTKEQFESMEYKVGD